MGRRVCSSSALRHCGFRWRRNSIHILAFRSRESIHCRTNSMLFTTICSNRPGAGSCWRMTPAREKRSWRGLLLKEMKLRGLIERVLIICPANLAFQWQREMADRFQETFRILRGGDLRVQYGVNLWNDHAQVVTSMDLAKREEILPSVRQAEDWDLIIVDEAHRMSARDAEHKSERYRPRGAAAATRPAHFLLLTATPHKGDPMNFTLFLQLLDQEAYADVKSIHDAMQNGEAACFCDATKEVMFDFPKRQSDGRWRANKLFKKRIPHTVAFDLEGEEVGTILKHVTRYVQSQSARAAEAGDERRGRAVGFIMAMYQRRMASSTHALKESLLLPALARCLAK